MLSEMLNEIEITESQIDRCILGLNADSLTAIDAAKAKWWTTELQKRIIDRGVQLHGGCGYMMEYPIGRAYFDARIQTIYGGATAIMKEIIGRDISSEFRRNLRRACPHTDTFRTDNASRSPADDT